MNELTLVIPAKNESESLPKVLKEIRQCGLKCDILITISKNDRKTINSIKNDRINFYYQNKKGYGAALKEAINTVNTKYFCIFNADGSFNPYEIYQQQKKLEKKNLDFIFSSRYIQNGGSEDDTYITLLGNFFFSLLGKFFFKLNISDILYTFVFGKTEKFKKIKFQENGFSFCVELPIKIKRNGFKMSDLPAKERARIAGKKKVNELKDGFLILICLIKLFFNNKK